MLSFEMAAKAQERMDEEIAGLAHTLSSLKTRKNTFALVSHLPPPILTRIFVYCACSNYQSAHRHDPGVGISRWPWILGVLHVCRHWRHVALTSPAVWSYLFVASRLWTEAFLARSLDSPLWICVKFYGSKKDAALGLMAMHTERLQECCLRFKLTRSDTSRALSMLSARAAPLLRVLKISFAVPKYLGRSIDTDRDGQAHPDNNHVLFNGNTPVLRELDLTNYGMPWCSFTLGRLTMLRVRNLAASVQLTMAELKIVLGRMPDLIQLHLENALRSGSPCQDCEKLHLRSLSRLRIRAPLSDIVSILCYVEIPSTTEVRLGCYQKTRPSADDFILLCSLLSQWLCASPNTATSVPIRAVAIANWEKQMQFVFGALGSDRDFHDFNLWMSMEDSSLDTPLVVDVHPWPPLAERSDDMIVHICQRVPLVHLRNIVLRNCRFSSTFWADTFWHLQQLRSIKLIHRGLSDLITTLLMPTRPPLPNTEGPQGRGPRQVSAPALVSWNSRR